MMITKFIKDANKRLKELNKDGTTTKKPTNDRKPNA